MLDPSRIAAMPAYMSNASHAGPSAYEEDCDWCMPVLIFENEFLAYYTRTKHPDIGAVFTSAEASLRNWRPAIYEQFYGVALKPEDPCLKRSGLSETKCSHRNQEAGKPGFNPTTTLGLQASTVSVMLAGTLLHGGFARRVLTSRPLRLCYSSEYRTPELVHPVEGLDGNCNFSRTTGIVA